MDSPAISQSDTNSNFLNWTSKVIAVFDNHAAVRYKRVKRETQPEGLDRGSNTSGHFI